MSNDNTYLGELESKATRAEELEAMNAPPMKALKHTASTCLASGKDAGVNPKNGACRPLAATHNSGIRHGGGHRTYHQTGGNHHISKSITLDSPRHGIPR